MATYQTTILVKAHDLASGPLGRITGAVGGLSHKLGRLGVTTQLAGFRTMAAVSAPATAGLKAMTDTAIDSDKAMRKLQGTARATVEEMAKFNQIAKNAALDNPFGVVENLDAMNSLAMSGVAKAAIGESLDATINLAVVGELDVDESARLVTDAVLGFGKTLNEKTARENTNRLADLATYASSRSNTTAGELFRFYRQAAPIANALNLTQEEATAIGMSMANAGYQGSNAGVGFKTISARFAAPTSKARGMFDSLGIDLDKFGAGNGTFDGSSIASYLAKTQGLSANALGKLAPTIDKIMKNEQMTMGARSNEVAQLIIDRLALDPVSGAGVVEGMSNYMTTQAKDIDVLGLLEALKKSGAGLGALEAIFGKRQLARGQVMVDRIAEIRKYVEELNDPRVVGDAERRMEQIMGGAYGASKRMTAALEVMREEMARAGLTDAITSIANGISKLAKWVGSLDNNSKRAVLGFTALAAAAGPVLIYVGLMTQGLASVVGGLGALGATSLSAAKGIIGVATSFSYIKPALLLGAIYAIHKGMQAAFGETPLLFRTFISSLGDVASKGVAYLAALATGSERQILMTRAMFESSMGRMKDLAQRTGKLVVDGLIQVFGGDRVARVRAAASRLFSSLGDVFAKGKQFLGGVWSGLGFDLPSSEELGARLGALIDSGRARLVSGLEWLAEEVFGISQKIPENMGEIGVEIGKAIRAWFTDNRFIQGVEKFLERLQRGFRRFIDDLSSLREQGVALSKVDIPDWLKDAGRFGAVATILAVIGRRFAFIGSMVSLVGKAFLAPAKFITALSRGGAGLSKLLTALGVAVTKLISRFVFSPAAIGIYVVTTAVLALYDAWQKVGPAIIAGMDKFADGWADMDFSKMKDGLIDAARAALPALKDAFVQPAFLAFIGAAIAWNIGRALVMAMAGKVAVMAGIAALGLGRLIGRSISKGIRGAIVIGPVVARAMLSAGRTGGGALLAGLKLGKLGAKSIAKFVGKLFLRAVPIIGWALIAWDLWALFGDSIKDAWEKVWPGLKKWFAKTWENVMGGVVNATKDAVKWVVDAINGVMAMIDAVIAKWGAFRAASDDRKKERNQDLQFATPIPMKDGGLGAVKAWEHRKRTGEWAKYEGGVPAIEGFTPPWAMPKGNVGVAKDPVNTHMGGEPVVSLKEQGVLVGGVSEVRGEIAALRGEITSGNVKATIEGQADVNVRVRVDGGTATGTTASRGDVKTNLDVGRANVPQ